MDYDNGHKDRIIALTKDALDAWINNDNDFPGRMSKLRESLKPPSVLPSNKELHDLRWGDGDRGDYAGHRLLYAHALELAADRCKENREEAIPTDNRWAAHNEDYADITNLAAVMRARK